MDREKICNYSTMGYIPTMNKQIRKHASSARQVSVSLPQNWMALIDRRAEKRFGPIKARAKLFQVLIALEFNTGIATGLPPEPLSPAPEDTIPSGLFPDWVSSGRFIADKRRE